MGKFFDALKKAENSQAKSRPKSTSRKIVPIPDKEVDVFGMDLRGQEETETVASAVSGKVDPLLFTLLDPQSPEAEIFKLLRAKIFCKDPVCRGRTILVTSPHPSDGKSFVAANLAVSIARGINEHVLLVDCDLRQPRLHKVFGLNARPGLREYLEDGTSIAPYLVKTPLRKLTMLPAGRPPTNPSELLSSEKMRSLINEIRSRYQDRYVILDGTPAKYTPEITPLSQGVDGILLVIRSGATPGESVLESIDIIGREKILGLVFNASEEVQKHYGYYYR